MDEAIVLRRIERVFYPDNEFEKETVVGIYDDGKQASEALVKMAERGLPGYNPIYGTYKDFGETNREYRIEKVDDDNDTIVYTIKYLLTNWPINSNWDNGPLYLRWHFGD